MELTKQRKRRAKKPAAENAAPAKTTAKKAVLTADEAAIAHRVMAESGDWKNIKESEVDDFSLANDPYRHPEPAIKMRREKKFAFKWIERKAGRVDQIRNRPIPFRWWVCNAMETPFLVPFLDSSLGCVCRDDQMLMFKPYWMFEKEMGIKEMQADRAAGSGDISAKVGKKEPLGGEIVAPEKSISSRDTVVFDEGANDVPESESEASEE